MIKLWRYPAAGGSPNSANFRGHGALCGSVSFTADDAHIITVGADDMCVLQWRHAALVAEELPELEENVAPADRPDYADGKQLERPAAHESAAAQLCDAIFAMEERGAEGDLMSVRACR